MATLATWPNPSVLDRVDGRYRGKIERDPENVRIKVKENIADFLDTKNPEILVSTIYMIKNLGLDMYNGKMAVLLNNHTSELVRSAALRALNHLSYENVEVAIQKGMDDRSSHVRTTAIELLPNLDIDKENRKKMSDNFILNKLIKNLFWKFRFITRKFN